MSDVNEQDDQIIVNCGVCGVPILTWWKHRQGGLLRGEYVLAGDLVLHPKCADAYFGYVGSR
jgi:hypothetical protein